MSKQITFIGAGSFTFTRTLVRDIFTFPAFADAKIVLMDVDPDRLEYIRKACENNRSVFINGNSTRIITNSDTSKIKKSTVLKKV